MKRTVYRGRIDTALFRARAKERESNLEDPRPEKSQMSVLRGPGCMGGPPLCVY